MTVPVDFYVAGVLARNFDPSVSQNLLKALAISSRTWAYNNSLWGRNVLETKDQYSYTYTDNKIIYDAVNATKDDVLADYDGYITPTEYYYVGDNGTIKESGKEKTITYELGYLYIDSTHKVMIPYNEQFNNTNIKEKVMVVSSEELPIKKGRVISTMCFVPNIAGIMLANYVIKDIILK